MDDKKIRAFLTIIQLGSLRRAAQELNYTQSGLTQMMKHLEQEVGCRLLRRSHSGVTMTESAEHLLPYFQAADQALLQLRHESEQFSGPQRKTIVIGAFPSIAKRCPLISTVPYFGILLRFPAIISPPSITHCCVASVLSDGRQFFKCANYPSAHCGRSFSSP